MPSPFPTPAFGGPMYFLYHADQPDYQNTQFVFQDGGASYNSDSDTPLRRFRFSYRRQLRSHEAAQLDAHYQSCQGELLGFDFYDPRTNILYTDVHYEK